MRNTITQTLLLSFIALFAFQATAQIKDPFTPRYSETVRGNFTTIANNMLSRTATGDYNGEDGNHDFTDNVYVDIDSDPSTFNSSNANFNSINGVDPDCMVIKKAYLYWAAADKEKDNGDDNQPGWNYNKVKLMLPGQGSYSTITADDVFYRGRSEHFVNDPYICLKDITSMVNTLSSPFGTYQVANIEAKVGELISHGGGITGTSGGWQIVFVYEETSLSPRRITLFDGYAHVTSSVNNFDINFSGFQTVNNGPVKADVVFGALEGDRDLLQDRLQIRNTANNFVDLSTNKRPANNFFNSRITNYGQDFTSRTPASLNTLGFDAGVFTLSNSGNSILDNNQTSSTIRLTSDQETYGLYLLGLSVESYEPELSPMLLTTSLAPNNDVEMGEQFTVSFDIDNYGNDDITNLDIQYELPEPLEYIGAPSLPNGITASYDNGSRILTFDIANNIVEVDDPARTITFELRIGRDCDYLDTSFDVQMVATYQGFYNQNWKSTPSSVSFDNCNIGDLMPAVIHINDAPDLSVSSTPSDADCNGAETGAIDISVTGGTQPYTYLWSNGATTQDISNVAAGTYSVVITDLNNCEFTETVTVEEPDAIDASFDITTATQGNSCNDGAATVNPSGGTQPYSYQWSASAGSQTTQTASNLPSGEHTVTITDANGCTFDASVVVDCDITGWDFVCGDDKLVDEYGYNANCSPNTTVSIPDAASVYQYVAEVVFKGSNPGATLEILDSSNNTHTLNRSVPIGSSSNIWVYRGLVVGNTSSVTYNASSALQCNLQSVVVYAFRNVVDASSSSGVFTTRSGYNNIETITIDIPTFTGPRNLEVVAPISELTDDGRYLLLRAEAGGISEETFIYGPDSNLPGGTCCLNIATIILPAVPGNVSQLTLTIDTRNGQNGQSVNGQSWVIASGVNVDSDCYDELELTATNVDDVLCHGENTGSITVSPTGGLPPYQYSLNGGPLQSDPTFSNLAAGVYSVRVEDSLGNEATISVTISEPEPLSIQITKVNATVSGSCLNGEATATPSGGTTPYTYQWGASAGNQTTQTAVDLPVGTHTVTITDANGCELQQSVAIDCFNDCDAVVSVDNITNILCKNEATGSATVSANSVANPSATFTFTWNTTPPQVNSGVTTSTVSNLEAGVYTVSVTIDGLGCLPVEQSITITEPSTALNVSATSTDESGPTTGDGTATANPSGGTPPYSYSWSPGGQTSQTITGLSAGTYTVTVTDANGCTATASTTVNPGTCQNLSVQANATPATCNGDSDGTATANVTGGSGDFSYAWSPGGQTTQTISGLVAGSYTVTVTDNVTLCTAQSTTTVNQPVKLSSGIAVNNVPCYGDSTGSLDLTVTGGTSPYSFLWSNGATTEDLSGLMAGTYSVTITDANGCTATNSATVQQPNAALSASITSQTDILCGAESSVTVEAAGGTAPYVFSLDGGVPQGTGTFTDLSEGLHTVTVTDANACTTSVEVTILKNCTDAKDDINNTYVNVPVSGNVLTNDTDAEGDTQTVTTTTVTTVQGVTVTIDVNTGAYTYTPPVDYIGADSFQYSIEDDGNPQATDTATVYIEVLNDSGPQNEPPVANEDANSTEVDTPVTGNVLVNDYDPDNDPITVTTTTVTTDQGVTVNIDPITGVYTYTPPTGYTGIDTFQYTICDDGTPALCDTAIVVITIIPDNGNVTFANDDAYNTTPGLAVSGNVLDNDFDPEGDIQTVDTAITPVSGPANGILAMNADGTFTYTPNPGFEGNDQFIYEIFDNGTPEARDQATVYLTVGGIANTTDAIDDINDTFVNVPVSGNVLTNDVDFEGDTQTVTTTTVTTAQGVTVTIAPTGEYTYTPPTDYVGEDTFQYTIVDNGNPQATDTATVYIEVTKLGDPQNEPPVANADTNTTEVDTPVTGNVLVNDYDPDGDPITVTTTTVTTAQGVTVTIDPITGVYTYTPPAGYTGIDTFQYTICDNGTPALCDTATVAITIIPDDGNVTIANDDSYFAYVNNNISGNVLDNDFDPEGDNQFVDTTITPVTGPSNGTLAINADGTFTYTPNTDYVGPDEFIYQIFDDGAPVATSTATVHLLIGLEGNTTEAIDDINDTFVNIPVSGNVLTNDVDAEGNTQTVTTTSVTTAQGVTVTIAPTGEYTYTPPTDYVGEDTFQYTIVDDGNPQATDTATVYIEVFPIGTPDNEPPVANADTNTTEVDTPVSGNVLVNDYDPDGDMITVTTTTVTTSEGVTVNIDPVTGLYTYTPPVGFTGVDTFQYTICDNGTPSLCDTATVTITIIDDNGNITVANDDSYFGYPNQDIAGNVLDNDSDPEGDDQTVDVSITPISGPANGTLAINADGTFTYTPNSGFLGADQFVYEIFDNGTPEARAQATVYLAVLDPGNAILAVDDINDTFVDLPVSGSVATNDENPDGPIGTEVFTLVSGPVNGGTLVFNPDGSYTYTPAPGYVGEDTFTYQVCDGGSPVACDTAVVTIEVVDDPIIGNDPPIANNDTNTTEVDTPVSGNVLVNDYDLDGDPISVTSNTDPSNGTLVINPDGTYTYTPNPGFEGEDSFEYTICDNGSPALCDTAVVTIYVISDNGNITVANDDAYYGEVEATIVGNVLDNDNDPEGDLQSVTSTPTPVSGPLNGTVTLNSDGSFVYTPNPGFTGTDQFVYSIIDDGTPSAEDQATVYILVEQTPAPAIAIIKEGVFVDIDQDQCADPDETIEYTFTVTNEGNVPLSAVQVTDPLFEAPNPVVAISGPSGDTNGNNLLDIDETWVFTASYAITQDDIDTGLITNQATATGTDPDGMIVEDLSDDDSILEDEPTVTTLCQDAVIDIVKSAVYDDGGDCSQPGELIDYTFTVTNQGNVSLSNVSVDDVLLGGNVPGPDSGDTDGDGELDVDETWTYSGSYTITQSDIDAGEVVNIATAAGTAPNGTVVTDESGSGVGVDEPTVTTLCQSPSIALIKEGTFIDGDGDECADVGETIEYTFTVVNTGNVSLTNVIVTDVIPVAGGPIDLAVGASDATTFTATYTITQADIDAGQKTNQATAEGTAPDGTVVSDLSDDDVLTEDDPTVTELCQNASIALIKVGTLNDENGNGCTDVEETISYAFTVVNTGNVTLTNIVINDALVNVIGGPITLAPGETDATTFTATYSITQSNIDDGFVQNQAEVTGNDPQGNEVSDLSDDDVLTEDDPTVTELCQNASIALIKEGTVNDTNGNGCADVKETITYNFTVINNGNVTINNIDISDALVNVQGGPITLAPGATDVSTFTAVYSITQANINDGFVENQAEVTGLDPQGNTVSDLSDDNSPLEDDPTITELCQNATIALIKVGTPTDENGNGCIDLGETIVYDFVVTNLGNVELTNVTVADPMVDVQGGPVTIAAGESDTETFFAVYTVTQEDVDNGFITNQATAEGTDPNGNVVTDLSDDNSNFEDDPTVSVLCQDASISVEKTGVWNDINGDFIPQVGETITYAFSVTNTGNVTLYDIMITDPLPGIEIMGGPIAQLEPGETDSETFTAIYYLTQADIDAGEVINQATATAVDASGNEVTDLSDDPNDPTNVDPDGDGDPDDPTITDIPNVEGAISFEIFNGITPNGDGLNDFFEIRGIQNFPGNNVKIFNRWGVLVWETDNYGGTDGEENVFSGESNGRATINAGEELPTGTYFYILNFTGDTNPGKSSYTGYLYINR